MKNKLLLFLLISCSFNFIKTAEYHDRVEDIDDKCYNTCCCMSRFFLKTLYASLIVIRATASTTASVVHEMIKLTEAKNPVELLQKVNDDREDDKKA